MTHTFSCDAAGRQSSRRDARNLLTEYFHDNVDREVERQYQDGTDFLTQWDAVGNRTRVVDVTGGIRNTYTFEYDDVNRLVRAENPGGSRGCLESLFEVVRESSPVILFLDGFVSLLKRPNGGSNSPLLKTLLHRPDVRIVGAATPWDYAESIGNDARMIGEFCRVDLSEPDEEETTLIVTTAAAEFAADHELTIDESVCRRTVALSNVFMLGESQPAKSVSLLRQVCDDRRFNAKQQTVTASEITVSDVIAAIAERTGIPVSTISGQGQELGFRTTLSRSVIGQDFAVQEVATELELISAGMKDPRKPASVLMFCGMTGVGKTELAKQIAAIYSSSRTLLTYPMGNFTESHSVSGIIGVPPGYVGHEQGGRLINDLRSDPYAVFLLDEAEKCHPNVWKPFLTLFDEGWIIDQRGMKAYADRAIFILTTNAGDRSISQLVRSGKTREEINKHVQQTLSRIRQERSSQPVFPPQFLSRINRIIVFNPLDEQAMIGISERYSQKLIDRWQRVRGKSLVIAPDVVREIARLAWQTNEDSNGEEGGRIVQKLFTDRIEHRILSSSLEQPDKFQHCREIHVQSRPAAQKADTSFQVEFI